MHSVSYEQAQSSNVQTDFGSLITRFRRPRMLVISDSFLLSSFLFNGLLRTQTLILSVNSVGNDRLVDETRLPMSEVLEVPVEGTPYMLTSGFD